MQKAQSTMKKRRVTGKKATPSESITSHILNTAIEGLIRVLLLKDVNTFT